MVHLKKSPRSYSKISAIANLFMQSAEHRLKCDIPVKSKKKNRKRRRQYDKRLPSVLVERLIKLLFVVGIHFLFQIHSYMHVYHCSCSICLIICHFSLKGFWTSKCNVTPTKSHNSLKWLCNFFMQMLFRKMIFSVYQLGMKNSLHLR